jgi:hypothetical protein
MGRFDRDSSAGVPASLDTATEELHSTLGRHVREIIEAAEVRASEIETEGIRAADQIERESRRAANETFKEALDRSARMLAAIDSVEASIGGNLASLRQELHALSAEFDRGPYADPTIDESRVDGSPADSPGEKPAPADGADMLHPDRPARADEQSMDRVDEPVTAEPPSADPPDASDPPDGADGGGVDGGEATATEASGEAKVRPPSSSAPSPTEADVGEMREMISDQIRSMQRAGRRRAEAERFLMRLKGGSHFIDLLDEIYTDSGEGQTSTRRTRGRRRRR